MNQVKEIFAEALERGGTDRAAYLDQACADQPELRAEVEALLEAFSQTSAFCETVAVTLSERPGAVVGRYKLLEQIGEGGFGVVYMAEQEAPVRRKVALKIIKLGMDTKQVVARFEAERQALAMMDHPGIAKVFDGGATETGRPYFVMELVRGIPITQYCDQNKLSIRQRLELFSHACQAVQHAHQKGIIHRDVKPSNVLVSTQDDRPVAKVIDFGIAKATQTRLTEKTLFTEFRQMIGTPEYMSPEQADGGLDIDTRSDIYSLGVLLYELLAGSPPFDPKELRSKAFAEMQRIIREVEPPTPSTRLSTRKELLPSVAAQRAIEPRKLEGILRGELDWIVMKALEKDRRRRYETANGLARDIQRYMADEPVEACPPSAGYRLRKFVRRNKRGLATAALLLVMLTAIVGILGWAVRDRAAQKYEAARARATRQAVIKERVELALEEARTRHREGRWREALDAAKRAEALAAGGESDEKTHQVALDTLGDMQMLAGMERARAEATKNEAGSDLKAEDIGYTRAFREYGIDIDTLDRDAAAALIQRRSIRYELAVFLDSWSQVRRRLEQNGTKVPGKDWKGLLEIARAVDSDPWRDAFRKAVLNDDRKTLIELSTSAPIASLPVETVDRLGDALMELKAIVEAADFLKKGQRLHPQDYWINVNLGNALLKLRQPYESIRYHSAATSLRPEATEPRRLVADALRLQAVDFAGRGRVAESLRAIDELVAGDNRPGGNPPETSTAVVLSVQYFRRFGYLAACRAATQILEKRPPAEQMSFYNTACCRALTAAAQAQVKSPDAAKLAKEDADLAIAWMTKAVAAGHDDVVLLSNDSDFEFLRDREDFQKLLAVVEAKAKPLNRAHYYILQNQWDKAAAEYAKANLVGQPLSDEAFAYACLFLIRGDREGYNRFCQELIQHVPQSGVKDYVLARTCAMTPRGPVDPDRVLQWANQVVTNSHTPWDYHVLGLAQYRAGQFDQALQSLTKANVPGWSYRDLTWFGLALVHHRLGDSDEARQCLAKGIQWLQRVGPTNSRRTAILSYQDWLEAQLLRREVEGALVQPTTKPTP